MYRQEFPNPMLQREHWENLNGVWEFEQDKSVSGVERKLFEKAHLSQKIEVPFCPESKLSGIGDTDFQNCVWYRRDFESHAKKGERTVLHFGAVDYDATVYLNGTEVFRHHGGYSSFSCDLTDYLKEGVNSLCVRAEDNDRNPLLGHGKQSRLYNSYQCYYTRVTGIWQTVWVEYVPQNRIKSFRFYPDIKTSTLTVQMHFAGTAHFTAEAFFAGKSVGKTEFEATGCMTFPLKLSELHLWDLGEGNLYDLKFTFGNDTVQSYCGMRSVSLEGNRFKLNGKTVFQRLVLDQGFYPDGIYTAKTKEALENDVILSMNAGFNGARLHQKVFEPLFLYYADLHGYLVWGEYGNWGYDVSDRRLIPNFLDDWLPAMERDFNHPSIIGWCPFNETWDYENRRQDDSILQTAYSVTKATDPTRPCIDTSGNYHVVTDIYDVHDYIQEPERFAELYSKGSIREMLEQFCSHHTKACKYGLSCPEGEPFFVSEYGGIKWDTASQNRNAWGYGNAPKTEEEFLARYKGLTDILLDNPLIMGFCYTQLYDVEQETNGLYTYERDLKFKDMDFFRKVNSRTAEIEKE